MSYEIYYFSGTGNSLSIARGIAIKTKGTLISIPTVMDKQSISTVDSIGIVFPAYCAQVYGVPLIVERFVRKLDDIGSKYIFAVCTCGGLENYNGLPALINLGKLIKSLGGLLSAKFTIKLPMNTMDYSHIPVPIDQNQERMFENCQNKVDEISQCVIKRNRSKNQFFKALLNLMMSPVYQMLKELYIKDFRKYAKVPEDSELNFYELMPLTDKSIYTNEKCNACTICVKVCPVRNITMVENRPVWQHHCEICLACAEWCPQKAIHHWGRVKGKYYHHPGVTVADMFVKTE